MAANRYSSIAIFLHWSIALLIIGQIVGGLVMVEFLGKGSALKFEIYQWHKSFGILILALSILRLLWCLTHRPPSLPDKMPGWERRLAGFTHIAFYGFLISMPLVGWAMVSVSPLGISTYLFETIRLPHMPFWEGQDNLVDLENLFKQIHEYMGFAMIGLLLLHIGAALKHHFHDRDDILSRMLPMIKSPNS